MRDQYLARAKEAQEEADRARDQESREGWLKIARGYLELAEQLRQTEPAKPPIPSDKTSSEKT